MSQAISIRKPLRRQSLRISNVDWQTYSRLLRIFEERPGFRLTYDRGELEIISPRLEHDDVSRFLVLLVHILTDELGLPFKPGGSTTMRRRLRQRGIEADECFWIANAHRMAGKRQLNLSTDPPPDLALEIDVTHSSLDRMAIYAALQVAEVWRLNGDVLTFHVLREDGTYKVMAASRSFPLLTSVKLLHFVQKARQAVDDNAVLREFREWIRQQRAKTNS
jgi:Uma2 family endonuclease